MAVQIKVSVDDRGVRKMLTTTLERTGDLSQPLGELGLWMVRDAGRRLRARGSEDMTGKLRASLNSKADAKSVSIASPLGYAAVQQLGHEGITPKPPHSYLAIPILDSLRRRDIWPSDLPDDVLHFGGWSRKGNPLLRGPDEKPWYVLVKEVKIDVEPYLVFGGAAVAFLKQRLAKWLKFNA